MNYDKFTKSEIEFEVKGKNIKFTIVHNLPNVFGMSINDAFENWVYRTNDYSPDSLCEYIHSKDPYFIALTEEEYNALNEN